MNFTWKNILKVGNRSKNIPKKGTKAFLKSRKPLLFENFGHLWCSWIRIRSCIPSTDPDPGQPNECGSESDPQHCTRQYKKRALIAFNWLCGTEWAGWGKFWGINNFNFKKQEIRGVWSVFLFVPKVSERGPNFARLVHKESALIFISCLSYDAHFHSTSSLITPIFIPRLLLRHLF